MVRTILSVGAAVCLVLLCLSGSAEALARGAYLAPNGRWIALARHAETNDDDWALDLLDVDCMFAGGALASCTRPFIQNVFLTPGASYAFSTPRWSSDSRNLIVNFNLYALSDPGKGLPAVRPLKDRPDLYVPMVFDSGRIDAFQPPKRSPSGDTAPGTAIFNGQAEIVGFSSGNSPTYADAWGHSFEVPGPMSPYLVPSRRAPLAGDAFYVWSASLGEHGLLLKLGLDGLTTMDLPSALRGPAQALWDASTSNPIAVFDPFGLYPLADGGEPAAWLETYVRDLRANDASFELKGVSLASAGKTAIVTVYKGPGCIRTYLVRPTQNRLLWEDCEAWAAKREAPALTSVTIPAAGMDLPAMLYRWKHVAGTAPRGLLIFFHGGPSLPTNIHDWDGAARALSDRFDILVVGFRGTPGYGHAHLVALHPPLADIAADDLKAAVAWAKAQPDIKGPIGFMGESWGGLAGFAALSHDVRDLSFIVAANGLIESPPGRRTNCKISYDKYLFGMTTGAKGACLLDSVGVVGASLNARIPVLMVNGEADDRNTTWDQALSWIDEAKAQGACVSLVASRSGAHKVDTWPEASVHESEQAMSAWVDLVLAHRPGACGGRTELP